MICAIKAESFMFYRQQMKSRNAQINHHFDTKMFFQIKTTTSYAV